MVNPRELYLSIISTFQHLLVRRCQHFASPDVHLSLSNYLVSLIWLHKKWNSIIVSNLVQWFLLQIQSQSYQFLRVRLQQLFFSERLWFLDLKVEPNLDAMLFGESVINDAVAIVLSEVSFRSRHFWLGFPRDFSISSRKLSTTDFWDFIIKLILKFSCGNPIYKRCRQDHCKYTYVHLTSLIIKYS